MCTSTYTCARQSYISLEEKLRLKDHKAPSVCAPPSSFEDTNLQQMLERLLKAPAMVHVVSKFLILSFCSSCSRKHSLSCLQSLSKVGAIFLSVPGSSYIKEIHGQDMSQGWAHSPNPCHKLISEERDEELGKCQTLSSFVCGHLRPFTSRLLDIMTFVMTHTLPRLILARSPVAVSSAHCRPATMR